MTDQATSYLIFVHVEPIPEDHEIVEAEKIIKAAAEVALPDYEVSITAAWVSDFQVISLSDLDNLPSVST